MNADAAPRGAIATDDRTSDVTEETGAAERSEAGGRPGNGRARPAAGEVELDVEDVDALESLEDIDDLEELDGGEDDLVDDDDDALSDTLGDEDSLDDDALATDAEDLDVVPVAADGKARPAVPAAEARAEAETDDDELLTDEVEASLDVILAERLRGGDADADDEVEPEDEDEDLPNQLATVIPVRRPEEFLCQSCFLLKPPGQLADRDHQLCRDCA